MKKKICMVVPSFSAKGGITSVVTGYRGSQLEKDYDIKYIETYCDGNRLSKLLKALKAYLTAGFFYSGILKLFISTLLLVEVFIEKCHLL